MSNVAPPITWLELSFIEFSLEQLHDLLKLRVDVFVVEQACAYAEIDGRDPVAWHIMGYDPAGALIAYARILPPGSDGLPHLGRFVVSPRHRGTGLGRMLVERGLAFLQKQFGSTRSALAAQSHLEKFYAAHGYARIGDEYVWDGIPHVDMRREQ